jgi:hypothetical protein
MSRVEAARQQWAEGHRRLELDRTSSELSTRLLEVATEELRKRVGETFTLAQLADEYGSSDHWLREAVEERIEAPGWQRQFSVVQDAAFHRYARAAADYAP